MTSKELHEQKIIPLRKELNRLEMEYKDLFRKECGEKIGERASCKNCAYSCVLDITDHNGCMYGRCTCCNDWCYGWMPENEVSAFLRMNYHYDEHVFYGLSDVLGDDFLKKADVNIVMELLKIRAKLDGKCVD